MRALRVALAGVALIPSSRAAAQARADSTTHGAESRIEYDADTDSTTRSLSAYAIVDTSVAPPDSIAVELSQRWQGRGTAAPVAAVELGLGRTRALGLRASRMLGGSARARPTVVFLLDGARRIRLAQSEYVSNGGATPTFETARYLLSAADLRLIATCRELRVWIGDRELWIDPTWRRVVGDMVAGQAR